MRTVRIALLGCGTVGRGLLELLERNRSLVRERAGVEPVVTRILVRDLAKERNGVERRLLTDRADEAIHGGADIVVELLGGIEPARSLLREAIASGRHVVTANKALLARHGPELSGLAARRGVRIGYEASVCGGIPIVRALGVGLLANRIESLTGILNGTCNYVLTRMDEDGMPFATALGAAQAEGFAEADASLDLDGEDAAQKLAILAALAFHVEIAPGEVRTRGIRGVELEDVRAAAALGRVVKLLATARETAAGLALRVEPVLLPRTHALAQVRREENAVLVRGDAVGDMILRGKGAGAAPTASAVLADIAAVLREDGTSLPFRERRGVVVTTAPPCEHYLRFPVADAPGVIGALTTVLGRQGISIQHAAAELVRGAPGRGSVRILTHACRERVVAAALEEIVAAGALTGPPLRLTVAPAEEESA